MHYKENDMPKDNNYISTGKIKRISINLSIHQQGKSLMNYGSQKLQNTMQLLKMWDMQKRRKVWEIVPD